MFVVVGICLLIAVVILWLYNVLVSRCLFPEYYFTNANNAAFRSPHNRLVPMADGVKIDTYACGNGPDLLFYLHGNAGSINMMWKDVVDTLAEQHPRFTVVTMDYRGYGFSGGVPTPPVITADATFFLETIRGNYERTVVYGRSLGGSVAINVCSCRPPVDALVLEAPFVGSASIHNRVLAQGLPEIFPVDINNVAFQPTLLLLAENDFIISSHRVSQMLTPAVHTTEILWGIGHNEIRNDAQYNKTITSFFDEIL